MQELGGSTARQLAQAGQWKSYHGCHAQFMNGDWPGGRNHFFFIPVVHEFESSLVWEFGLFQEFGLLLGVTQNSRNLQIPGTAIAAWGLAVNWSSGGEKTVLCIVCLAYSLL